jgi:hypothetical protein
MGATQVLTKEQAQQRMQAGCPACGSPLKVREIRRRNADTGLKTKRGGEFLGCSRYGRGCDADYYFSFWTLVEKVIPGVNEVPDAETGEVADRTGAHR